MKRRIAFAVVVHLFAIAALASENRFESVRVQMRLERRLREFERGELR